tara:strand:- start:67 stop:237 length:171 start_codon:yes stop_codon:yes gene_type:complete
MFVLIALSVITFSTSVLLTITGSYALTNASKVYAPVKSVASGVIIGLITGFSIGLT